MKFLLLSPVLMLAMMDSALGEFDFRQQVQPVLENACIRCHGAEKAKGGLRLDSKEAMLKGGDNGPVVVPGNLDKSEIVRRITLPRGHEDLMPQESDPLSGPHRKWLLDWVKQGAVWPDGLVLKPKKREIDGLLEQNLFPTSPPKSLSEAAKSIDEILRKENAADKSSKPLVAPAINDTMFLRRATLDLIGRIPTMDEIIAYEKDSPNTRRQKLVDQLLAHPRFIERWTVFFADMLRIRSDAEGGDQLLAYVNRSLKDQKPYDTMVRELISTNGRPTQAPAAGFVLSDAANPMALAGATAQIFLGVRLACAECHDHPFDDWKQKEFYQLAAFFGQTKRVEVGKARKVYSTEGKEMMVQWPPESENPPKRDGVTPRFPIELVKFKTTPNYLTRLAQRRQPATTQVKSNPKELDSLLDIHASGKKAQGPDVMKEATEATRKIDTAKDIYKPSELREKLADLITDPRNPYFARAFVNRVWAELVGRGFVEPLDNFSAYNQIRHPQTLQFLAQEFVASGYDFQALVKTILLTDAYQRGHLPSGTSPTDASHAEEKFTATRTRRMLGEVLFDSIATSGHLQNFKWPAGANRREVKRQVRVPLVDEMMGGKSTQPAEIKPAKAPVAQKKTAPSPYDLEKNISLDFDALLKKEEMKEVTTMKMEADAALEAAKMATMQEQNAGSNEKYRLETVTEEVDDNPKFDSTLRMAAPAPPSHFLRVFGQPSREGLGEFRDEAPSLRQELMLLNGKATHEAARVGPLEPIHKLISPPDARIEPAVEFAYREILTRAPTAEELADATTIVSEAPTKLEGMADLRWALLNCHEFRYLP